MTIIVKSYDEGTRSPFIARLFLGMLKLRNLLEMGNIDPRNRPISRQQFYRLYNPLFMAMKATLDAAREIAVTVENHKDGIVTRRSVTFQGNTFTITKTIDNELNQLMGIILSQGIIAAKDRLQTLLKELYDLDIGYLYQGNGLFADGVVTIQRNREDAFADYLMQVRTVWLQEFQLLRNKREHEGWTVGQVQYRKVARGEVEAIFPHVGGVSVEEFARQSANRILLFVENTIAYGFQRSNRVPIFLFEVPKADRDPSNCQRFRPMPKSILESVSPWEIAFHDDLEFL